MNTLYYGDNLDILRRYIDDESVDLVYLDPPFKSNQDYNVLFQEQNGSRAKAQIKAFEDTWQWNQESARAFEEVIERGGPVSLMMQAFKTFLGFSDMLAYLAMMAPRLLALQAALKPTGSIYLHCDPAASHYLKLLMDSLFGPTQFRNEIIWRRTGSHNSPRRFGPIHDTLLFYSKTDQYYFKRCYRPYLKGHVDGYFKGQDEKGKYWTNALTGAGTRRGKSGEEWRGYDPTSVGRHWAIPSKIVQELGLDDTITTQEKLDALDEAGFIDHPPKDSHAIPTYRQYLKDSPGMPLQDIWAYQPHTRGTLYESDEALDEDVRWLVAQGDPERLGYQTQKPKGLLRRIIQSSCPPEGVVLDPFCGCGTAIVAAQSLNLRWVGIDITQPAMVVIKDRLSELGLVEKRDYLVRGEPTTIEGARTLAKDEPYQFQWWAVGKLGARGTEEKKGPDRGIDGRLYFHDEPGGKTKQIIFSVKSGDVDVSNLRELRGVVEREKAEIGVFIAFRPPTPAMKKEVASAGFYASRLWDTKYPRLQILTIAQILDGKGIEYPPSKQVNVTFKKAKKAKTAKAAIQPDLLDEP